MSKGLGRFVHNDINDSRYLMRSVLRDRIGAVPEYNVWQHGDPLDQGEEGACVGFSWTNWYNCKPKGFYNQKPNKFGFLWYEEARRNDPWPGEDYEGTALRAGAKVGKQWGFLDGYLWAASVIEIRAWVLTKGPVVVASDWFYSMDDLNPGNTIRVEPSTRNRGGHAYLLIGINEKQQYVFLNSWGANYGNEGKFYMDSKNFDTLVKFGNSEFCTSGQTSL